MGVRVIWALGIYCATAILCCQVNTDTCLSDSLRGEEMASSPECEEPTESIHERERHPSIQGVPHSQKADLLTY